jgi:6,7-dimethyl-8-ribityllumazine synthase
MATKGNTKLTQQEKPLDIAGAKVVVIKTAWNNHITDELALGCIRVLKEYGVKVVERTVPGAVELTYGARHFINNHAGTNACIVLGCIIRGDTPHFDYVCQSVTQGITMLNAQLPVPVIFGVLTVNTEEQALERIGGIHGHKGEEAAMTALQMIDFERMG